MIDTQVKYSIHIAVGDSHIYNNNYNQKELKISLSLCPGFLPSLSVLFDVNLYFVSLFKHHWYRNPDPPKIT
jgi:hypothetical protein